MPAPIALFAYNRPEHLRHVLQSLAVNAEAAATELYVFSDGARDAASAPKVAEVRSIIAAAQGFLKIIQVLRESNLGLARSIIDGVGHVCEAHGEVIVVEDDLIVSPHFLCYMNAALRLYEHDERVVGIHGYVYPVATALPETFFLRGADCWGWATWQRGWKTFDADGAKLLAELERRDLAKAFDLDGAYAYTGMLRDQISRRNDSWAIRWHASAFLADKLTLYPGRSLVENIGADGSGTNVKATCVFAVSLADTAVTVERIPLEENVAARAGIIDYFRASQPTLLSRLKGRLTHFAGHRA